MLQYFWFLCHVYNHELIRQWPEEEKQWVIFMFKVCLGIKVIHGVRLWFSNVQYWLLVRIQMAWTEMTNILAFLNRYSLYFLKYGQKYFMPSTCRNSKYYWLLNCRKQSWRLVCWHGRQTACLTTDLSLDLQHQYQGCTSIILVWGSHRQEHLWSLLPRQSS